MEVNLKYWPSIYRDERVPLVRKFLILILFIIVQDCSGNIRFHTFFHPIFFCLIKFNQTKGFTKSNVFVNQSKYEVSCSAIPNAHFEVNAMFCTLCIAKHEFFDSTRYTFTLPTLFYYFCMYNAVLQDVH